MLRSPFECLFSMTLTLQISDGPISLGVLVLTDPHARDLIECLSGRIAAGILRQFPTAGPQHDIHVPAGRLHSSATSPFRPILSPNPR